ncbi:MAG: outer rane usher protein [Burkholderiales bacterium]
MPAVSKPKSSWTSRKALLLASLSLCAAPCALSAADANDAPGERLAVQDMDLQPVLLMVDINQQRLSDTVLLLKGPHGELYAAERDLQNWRLRLPGVAPVTFRGVRYTPLAALPGVVATLDDAKQSLNIEARPETFASTDISAPRPAYPEPILPSPGMFFNYDLLSERESEGTHGSGLFELGAFNALGTGLTSVVIQRGLGESRSVRLDTSFTVDQPKRAASIRVGDAISRPASVWGRAVRFGGAQYSTNFATQPGLITFPIQSFSGQAALPSTVDVYVNNVIAASRQVPPGPFSITDVPVVSGRGDANIVVRDLLGREQVVSQPFYASPMLLRKGLQDFSFESGALRENYGIRSNDYGTRFATSTYRVGISDALTGEGHLQWQENHRAAGGMSVLALFPSLGTLSTSAAVSRSDAGNGRLWTVGFERQSRLFSFGLRTQLATENFTQVGSDAKFPDPRRLTTANMGLAAGRSGSFGTTFVRQDVPGAGRAEIAGISYSLSLGRAGLIGISAFKNLHGAQNHSISAYWAMPLGRDVNMNVAHTVSRERVDQTQVQVQRNLPSGDGYGYRLQSGRHVPHQAALLMQNRVGTYSVEAANFADRSSVRAGMAGGVAVLGGSAFLSRRINESFGVVQVPGMENVRVYVDNQLVARTDAEGNALIPRLRPYDNNPVHVEHTDLRMDTKIRSLTANPVPYARSGVLVRIPIEKSNGALLKLVSDDGTPLPAGTEVEVEGQETPFPVAMDGAVYVTGLKAMNRMRASSGGRVCAVSVTFKASDHPVPDLGTFKCRVPQP